ncbi:hypothetical protein CIHG_06327 [Coccidioides immitis H538.4]|uniref:Uncharacterized protein n=2 Tax=Coccidioides immitis TaxID=5501 RepID=A0A0J8RUT7_COCIT|nr:hypothetical protein CIRG_09608 [Coccidioides immitis RMSCC 2394]KMU88527.1 hypothetical protein CIHG_06327 [Coccidioides immitis H538.4]
MFASGDSSICIALSATNTQESGRTTDVASISGQFDITICKTPALVTDSVLFQRRRTCRQERFKETWTERQPYRQPAQECSAIGRFGGKMKVTPATIVRGSRIRTVELGTDGVGLDLADISGRLAGRSAPLHGEIRRAGANLLGVVISFHRSELRGG